MPLAKREIKSTLPAASILTKPKPNNRRSAIKHPAIQPRRMQLRNKQRQTKRAISITLINNLKHPEIHIGIKPNQKKQAAKIRNNPTNKLPIRAMENFAKIN